MPGLAADRGAAPFVRQESARMVFDGTASRLLRRLAALAVAVLALSACDDDRRGQAKRAQTLTMPAGQCLPALADAGLRFTPVDPVAGADGCGIAVPVTVSGATAALSRPATMACPLALRLAGFERDVLQPLALRYFGQGVTRIHHYGAYNCRDRRGAAGQRSEHAHGRAFDISAFQLADGTVIRVKQDWGGVGRRARFLHNVAREACGHFHMVLSPGHDRAHHDHLHFDIGPWRMCGT